ncbi:MAG: hypothetical protein U0996_15185 [Planctomycetaceae bacterium]
MTDDTRQFELVPFFRSPGGCLVTTLLLLIGGCIGCDIWLAGADQYSFDLGNGRHLIAVQARDKSFDQWTTYEFKVIVSVNDQMVFEQHLSGTPEREHEFSAKLSSDGNLAGILWPGSNDDFRFIYDFANKRGYGPAAGQEELQKMKELEAILLSPDAKLIPQTP